VLGIKGAKKTMQLHPLNKPVMLIDGHRVEVIGPLRGHSELQSVFWVPSI
jgi:hypothetical protein